MQQQGGYGSQQNFQQEPPQGYGQQQNPYASQHFQQAPPQQQGEYGAQRGQGQVADDEVSQYGYRYDTQDLNQYGGHKYGAYGSNLNFQYSAGSFHAVFVITIIYLRAVTTRGFLPCDASLKSFCVYGDIHSMNAPQITGEYVYSSCQNNTAIYSNINRKFENVSLSHYKDYYGITMEYNSTSLVFAGCFQSNILQCSGNWLEFIDRPWFNSSAIGKWVPSPNVYSFAESCDIMLSTVSYCNNNINYVEELCYSGFDTQWAVDAAMMNGQYTPVGCNANYPYYKNKDNDVYISYYYDSHYSAGYDDFRWVATIGESDIAYCSEWLLRSCANWWLSIDGTQELQKGPYDGIVFNECDYDPSFTRTSWAVIIWCICVTLCLLIIIPRRFYLCCKKSMEIESDMSAQIQAQAAQTTVEVTNIQPSDDSKEPAAELSATKTKCDHAFWAKIVIKTLMSAYDLYTDIVLGIEWINGYDIIMQNGESCSIDNMVLGGLLLGVSFIGFVLGSLSLITSFKIHGTTDPKAKATLEANEFVFDIFKYLFEDVMTICLCFVLFTLVGNASAAFYLSFFTSCGIIFVDCARRVWSGGCTGAGACWGLFAVVGAFAAALFLFEDVSKGNQGYVEFWIDGQCITWDEEFLVVKQVVFLDEDTVWRIKIEKKESFTKMCDPIFIFGEEEWCTKTEPLFECTIVSESDQRCTIALTADTCIEPHDCVIDIDTNFTACLGVLQIT